MSTTHNAALKMPALIRKVTMALQVVLCVVSHLVTVCVQQAMYSLQAMLYLAFHWPLCFHARGDGMSWQV